MDWIGKAQQRHWNEVDISAPSCPSATLHKIKMAAADHSSIWEVESFAGSSSTISQHSISSCHDRDRNVPERLRTIFISRPIRPTIYFSQVTLVRLITLKTERKGDAICRTSVR
jgi:hypothetical protein